MSLHADEQQQRSCVLNRQSVGGGSLPFLHDRFTGQRQVSWAMQRPLLGTMHSAGPRLVSSPMLP